jgi:RNA polymerase sigma factor (sigma-70 family)
LKKISSEIKPTAEIPVINHKTAIQKNVKEQISDEYILNLLGNPTTYEKGFRLLMTTYQEPLYRHVRRMVFDHDDANDVIQNTFIKVYRNVERFEGKSKLYTWLYRIATNEAITFLNSRQRRDTDTLDNPDHAHVANSLRADAFFDGDEVQIKLVQAIALLPDKQRLVFNMRYYEEMPYEDMSNVLGTSVGALKASYFHAVRKIEGFFKGIEID